MAAGMSNKNDTKEGDKEILEGAASRARICGALSWDSPAQPCPKKETADSKALAVF
jgi:hypothetical protein